MLASTASLDPCVMNDALLRLTGSEWMPFQGECRSRANTIRPYWHNHQSPIIINVYPVRSSSAIEIGIGIEIAIESDPDFDPDKNTAA